LQSLTPTKSLVCGGGRQVGGGVRAELCKCRCSQPRAPDRKQKTERYAKASQPPPITPKTTTH